MYKVIIFLALAAFASAQIKYYSRHELKPLTHFDKTKLSGKWYVYAYIPDKFEPNAECSQVGITLNSNGTLQSRINIFNTVTGYYQRWGGLAVPCGPLPSEFTYVFPPGAVQRDFELKFIDADENLEHYYVVVVIQKLPYEESLEYVWISSRYPNLEEKFFKKALWALECNKINPKALKLQRHDCPSN